jgi:hypothetical protein
MRVFRELGEAVGSQWRACNYDHREFAEIASSALHALKPSDRMTSEEVVRWVLETTELPPQTDLLSAFGSPAITVFRDQRFYIDVLYWVDGTTDVHQHAFSGAFHVMVGGSLHCQFSFTETARWSERLKAGRLDLLTAELLRAGDVRPIAAGETMIHSLFHLERPSLSVVIRTPADPFAGPQYSYSRGGLAHDAFYRTEACLKGLQTLSLLWDIECPDREELALAYVRRCDAFTAFLALRELAERIRPFDHYCSFLERAGNVHGGLPRFVRISMDERRRESKLIAQRRSIRSREHRLFLAILLNVTRRSTILDLVRQAQPGADPVDTIVRWTSELARTHLGDQKENVLGIELNESALDIFRLLAAGCSDSQLPGALTADYEEAEVESERESILATAQAFRQSLVFRGLLGAGE